MLRPQVPEDVKAKVEAKTKELKDAIPTDDVAKVGSVPLDSTLWRRLSLASLCLATGGEGEAALCMQAPRPCPALYSAAWAPCMPPHPPPSPPSLPVQIKAAMEELQKEVMSLGQAVYGQGQGGAAPGGEAGSGEAGSSGSAPKGDDVIDAEFTESDKDKKN